MGAAAQKNDKSASSYQFREASSRVDDLCHAMNNHEIELRQIDEKFANITAIVDSLRKQLDRRAKEHKEQLQLSESGIESKVCSLELAVKGLSADICQIKKHINDSLAVFSRSKEKLEVLESEIKLQNQNIDHLQSALKTLISSLSKNEEDSQEKVYCVKSGDSLEKIANAHQTTVKAIKEANQLTNDRIIINQKLKIPD